ncbi:alpha/beta fold hydrolase [Emcibacter sp. SYSU 3D8]|uniref:alpha/beta fold hydrolase n=1 Tax=Emcibacter sp. SYSU 3D8 TaxID=3133969 RepID=UPI0031FEC289
MISNGIRHFRLGSDMFLAGCEYMGQFIYGPMALTVAPRATGPRAVITIPGYTGTDEAVAPLNDALAGLGYTAESWGLGINTGVPGRHKFEQQINEIAKRASRLAETTGTRVSLVGHSLGGMFAREIGRRFPQLIDRVITMGSPAHMTQQDETGAIGTASGVHGRPLGRRDRDHLFSDQPPPGMPLVAIYSRLDAIAPVKTTQIPADLLSDPDGSPRENVEVLCSHLGMAVNPLVQIVVADRLARPLGDWQAFEASRYFPLPVKLAHSVFYPPVNDRAPA